jgi:Domain of unknown function (DUF4389)
LTPWRRTGPETVAVWFDEFARINRLWGIPLLGIIGRAVIAIPLFVILWLLAIVSGLVLWFAWIPVLFFGHQADLIVTVVGAFLRNEVRIAAWLGLLSGKYPPFSLAPELGEHAFVEIPRHVPIGRLWGFPVLGFAVRSIVLIPHYIVLFFLGMIALAFTLISWAPVLFLGRQSHIVYRWVGGYLRYQTKVFAWHWLLSRDYPPFRLSD